MKELKERVSYLQGLSDGLNIEANTKEGRLLSEIIGVLGDFADYLVELEEAQLDLEDYVESIDEDLYSLEDEIDEIMEIDEEDLDDIDLDEDIDYVDVECPGCQEIVCFESDILNEAETIEVTCPNCDEVVFVNDMDSLENDDAIDGQA